MSKHGTAINIRFRQIFTALGACFLLSVSLTIGQTHTLQAATSPSLPTGRTVKLGTYKNANALRNALKQAGCLISEEASDILSKPAFTVSSTEIELELVKVSQSQLGFPEGARFEDIYKRALAMGLALCPSEVGPQLRLQYKDQPELEWLFIAMEPILGSDNIRQVFTVDRHDRENPWLRTYVAYQYGPVNLKWVFTRRK